MPKRIAVNWGAVEREAGFVTTQVLRRIINSLEDRGGGGGGSTTIRQSGGSTGRTPPITLPLRLIGSPAPQLIIGFNPATTWHIGAQSDSRLIFESQADGTFQIRQRNTADTSAIFEIVDSSNGEKLEVNSDFQVSIGSPSTKGSALNLIPLATASAGGAGTDPENLTSVVGNLLSWYRVEDITGVADGEALANNDPIWADKAASVSGSANTDPAMDTVTPGGVGPIYYSTTDTLNGYPYIMRNPAGISGFGAGHGDGSSGNWTLIAVYRAPTDLTLGASMVFGATAATANGWELPRNSTNGKLIKWKNDSGFDGSDTFDNTTGYQGSTNWHISVVRKSSTTVSLRQDGVARGSAAVGDNLGTSQIFNGKSGAAWGSRDGVALAEYIWYNTAISDSEAEELEAYLTDKYFQGNTHLMEWEKTGGEIDGRLTSTGKLGVGTTAPEAKVQAVDTAEQFRLGYDASNYVSFTVDSSGNLTVDLTGTSPIVTLSDDLLLASGNLYFTSVTTGSSITTSGNDLVVTPDIDSNTGKLDIQGFVEITSDTTTAAAFKLTGGSGTTGDLLKLDAFGGTERFAVSADGYVYGPVGNNPMTFFSQTDDVSGLDKRGAYIFHQDAGADASDYHTDWKTSAATILRLTYDGRLYKDNDSTDEFLHEQGTHAVSGTFTWADDTPLYFGSGNDTNIQYVNADSELKFTAANAQFTGDTSFSSGLWIGYFEAQLLWNDGASGAFLTLEPNINAHADYKGFQLLNSAMRFDEITAPSDTPDANTLYLYVDGTSNNLTVKKDDGSTVDLESGFDPGTSYTWTADQTVNDGVKWIWGDNISNYGVDMYFNNAAGIQALIIEANRTNVGTIMGAVSTSNPQPPLQIVYGPAYHAGGTGIGTETNTCLGLYATSGSADDAGMTIVCDTNKDAFIGFRYNSSATNWGRFEYRPTKTFAFKIGTVDQFTLSDGLINSIPLHYFTAGARVPDGQNLRLGNSDDILFGFDGSDAVMEVRGIATSANLVFDAGIDFEPVAGAAPKASGRKTLFLNATSGRLTATDFSGTSVTVETPITTKGDLEAGKTPGGGTTSDRLAIGTDGQVLMADSAQTLGMKWSSTWTADQTFNDNVKLLVGTSGDGSLYHNGTDTVLDSQEVSTSSYLRIGTTDTARLYFGADKDAYIRHNGTTTIFTTLGSHYFNSGSGYGHSFLSNNVQFMLGTSDYVLIDDVDLRVDGGAIRVEEIAAPSTPAANFAQVHLNSTSEDLEIVKDDGSRHNLERSWSSITRYVDLKARNAEYRFNGLLENVVTAGSVSSGSPQAATVGMGKVIVVVNAGSDTAGSLTVTGTSVDRDSGTETGSDTDTLTISGLTTDGTDTDASGNTRWSFSNAYITSKWFTGSISISTTDVNLSDIDVYLVAFEQFNDNSDTVVETVDITAYANNTSAWLYGYLYKLAVSGDTCSITRQTAADVAWPASKVAATGSFRYRRGDLAIANDGTTDGMWYELHLGPLALNYWENVNWNLWFHQPKHES